ncbi:MAG: hypothetical protein KF683_05380 [Rubrivivax sp.]|nr:hypothetical protein [Rubrivivax sp.]
MNDLNILAAKPIEQAGRLTERGAGTVAGLARDGLRRAGAIGSDLGETLGRAGNLAVGSVRDEPVKAVLVALAAGAALATLVGVLARRAVSPGGKPTRRRRAPLTRS